MKKSASPLPRSLLVQRCLNDFSLIDFIISECTKRLRCKDVNENAYITFVFTILSEVIARTSVDDSLLHRLLPFLLKGLKTTKREHFSASLMLISLLTSKVLFEADVIHTLLNRISRSGLHGLQSPSLICIAILCNTQKIDVMSSEIIDNLFANYPQVLFQFIDILEKYSLAQFPLILSRSLLSHSFVTKDQGRHSAILSYFTTLPDVILNAIVLDCTLSSFRLLFANRKEKESSATTKSILRYFDGRCGDGVDEALNKMLLSKSDSRKMDDESDSSDSEDDEKKETEDGDDVSLCAWLAECVVDLFPRSRHYILNESRQTLSLSLTHSSESIRLLAIEKAKGLINPQELSHSVGLIDNLIDRLTDSNDSVAISALNLLNDLSLIEENRRRLFSRPNVCRHLIKLHRSFSLRNAHIQSVEMAVRLLFRLYSSVTELKFEDDCDADYARLLCDLLVARESTASLSEVALQHVMEVKYAIFSYIPRDSIRKQLKQTKKAPVTPKSKKSEQKHSRLEDLTSLTSEVVEGVAAALLSSSDDDATAMKWIDALLGSRAGVSNGKDGFFSTLFAFLVLIRVCQALQKDVGGGSALTLSPSEPKTIALLRYVLLLFARALSLFASSTLSRKGVDEETLSLQQQVSVASHSSADDEIRLFTRASHGKETSSRSLLLSSLLLLSLNTILSCLPVDKESPVYSCHHLFGIWTSIDILQGEPDLAQLRTVLASTHSSLYIFFLSAPSLSTFMPQLKTFLTQHVESKFLVFNSVFYTSPINRLYLERSFVSQMTTRTVTSWFSAGSWQPTAIVQCRSLAQVNLFLASLVSSSASSSLDGKQKGKRKEKSAPSNVSDSLLFLFPTLLVAAADPRLLHSASDCLQTLRTILLSHKGLFSSSLLSAEEFLHLTEESLRFSFSHLSLKEEAYLMRCVSDMLEKDTVIGSSPHSALVVLNSLLKSSSSVTLLSPLLSLAEGLVVKLRDERFSECYFIYLQMLRAIVSFAIPHFSSSEKNESVSAFFNFFVELLGGDATSYVFLDTDDSSAPSLQFTIPNVIAFSLSTEVFESLSDERKLQLLLRLCNLAFGAEVVSGSDTAKSLIFDFQLTPSLFANAISSIIPGHFKIISKHSEPKKKKRSAVTDALEVAEEEARDKVDGLINILKALQSREDVLSKDGVSSLVPSLLDILAVLISKSNGLDEISITQLAIQLVLTLSRNVLNVMRTGNPVDRIEEVVGEEKEKEKKKVKKEVSKKSKVLPWKQLAGKLFTIDGLVNFFTSTVDMRNNNATLLLLAEISRSYPHQVLPSVPSIFTRMGTDSLRRDDNYTFLVIQQAIEAIVPAVMDAEGCNISTVIDLLVDALPHIPQHRRLILFAMFIRVVKMETFPHILLELLLKGLKRGNLALETEDVAEDKDRASSFDYRNFILELCHQFSPFHITRAFGKLFHVLLSVSVGETTEEEADNSLVLPSSFSVSSDVKILQGKILKHTEKRSLRVLLTQVMCDYFTSETVLEKLIALDRNEERLLNFEYLHLFQFALLQLRQLPVDSSRKGFILSNVQSDDDDEDHAESSDEMSDADGHSRNDSKYFSALRTLTNDLIDTLQELMPIAAFTRAIRDLLQYPDSSIRQTALRMLNDKILKATEHNMLTKEHIRLFLSMVDVLVALIQNGLQPKSQRVHSGEEDEQEMQEEDGDRMDDDDNDGGVYESAVNIQTALLSLEILARYFSGAHPDTFAPSLSLLPLCMRHKSIYVVSSAVIAFATHCAEMKVRCLAALKDMVPLLLSTLKSHIDDSSSGSNVTNDAQLVLLSILSAFEVLFLSIGQFLSPYLANILSCLIHPLLCTSSSHSRKLISEKSGKVLEIFALHIETRYALNAIFEVFQPSVVTPPQSLCRLISVVSNVMKKLEPAGIAAHHKRLLGFFLEVFDYRRAVALKKQNISESSVKTVESSAIGGFLEMVVKLNEITFKPLFLKVLEWSCSASLPVASALSSSQLSAHMASFADLSRAHFFFALTSEMALKLKSIFTPYFNYYIDHMLSYVTSDIFTNGVPTSKKDVGKIPKHEKKLDPLRLDLLIQVVKNFRQLFAFDTGDVVDVNVFHKVVTPLVNLLECCSHRDDQKYREVTTELTPCLVQLAVVVNSDLLWKTLNHKVLMMTRHALPRVRCAALQVEMALYDKFGEEFLILLPESVSFFSELMEDSDQAVESSCRKLMKKIDALLGDESIRDYF
jgi:hypothetical protein